MENGSRSKLSEDSIILTSDANAANIHPEWTGIPTPMTC